MHNLSLLSNKYYTKPVVSSALSTLIFSPVLEEKKVSRLILMITSVIINS